MKKIILPVLILSLALMVFFREPVMGFFLKACVNGYCRHHFGKELYFDKIYKEQDRWVFEKPILEQSGARLSADRLLLRGGIKPLKSTLDLQIEIENSRIDLMEEVTNLEDMILELIAKSFPYWLFKVHTSFVIKDGVVSWYEDTGRKPEPQFAEFSFTATSKTEKKQADLSLFLEGKENVKNSFELSVTKEKDQPLLADLLFKEVDCRKISRIYQVLGHPFQGWSVYDGKIDGRIHFQQPEDSLRSYIWGEALLSRFSYGNSAKEIVGSIQEAGLNLQANVGPKEMPRISGKVELSQEASLTLAKDGVPYWELSGLTGMVSFLPEEGISALFQAACRYEDRPFGVVFKGDASIFDEAQAALELSCFLSSGGANPMEVNQGKGCAEVRFTARQLGKLYNSAEIEINNLGKEEFGLIQAIMTPYYSEAQRLKMRDGSLAASGIAYLRGYRLTDIRIDSISAENLLFEWDPLDFSISIGQASGDFSIQLGGSDPLESLDANFALSDGRMQIEGLNGNPLVFEGLGTNLAVRKGALQRSEIEGILAGLAGTLSVNWQAQSDFLSVDFSGRSEKILTLLPESLSQPIEPSVKGKQIRVSGGMSWIKPGARFKGELSLGDSHGDKADSISFGFDIERSSEKLWKRWPADELAVSYWEKAGLESLQKVMPPITYPALLLQTNWIKSESGIAGLVVRKGWFEARGMPLENYLAPFVFPDQKYTLSGAGSFKGSFDHKSVFVEYEAENVTIENGYLSIYAEKIRPQDTLRKASASHYFNFETKTHYGTIPLSQAVYLEKGTGLRFTQLNSLVVFEGAKIHFKDLSTQCSGILLGGAVDIDFDIPNDGIFTVDVAVDHMLGSLSDARAVLKELYPEAVLAHLPLEGKISMSEGGARLSLNFSPEDCQCGAMIRGKVTNAFTMFENSPAQLKDVKLSFSYDHGQRAFEMTQIYGNIEVQEGPQKDEYSLSGDYVRFSDYTKGVAEFDLWVGDQSRDIVRLAGMTLPVFQDSIAFHLDPVLTHFGDMHPSDFQFVVKEWSEVEKFRLKLDIQLNTLLGDLQRLGKSGVLLASNGLIKGINHMQSAEGNVKVELLYDGDSKVFSYSFAGDSVSLGEYHADHLSLCGRNAGGYWCLDNFQLDDLFLSGYIKSVPKGWNFNQLKLRYGASIVMEVDGDYIPNDNAIGGHIQSMELDLARLKGFNILMDDFVDSCSPHGRLSATGELRLDISGNPSSWKGEAILDASLEAWDVNGLHFQDVRNVSCHFVSDQGITFRNLSTSIVTPDTRSSRGHISIEKAYFEFLNGEVLFDSMDFQFPAHHLPWMADALNRSFPNVVTSQSGELMRSSKLQGSLEGSLRYEFNPPYSAMKVTLKDGVYFFLNTEHEVKNFVMEYDPFEFNVSSKYIIGDQSVWLYARSTSPSLSNGELIITDLPLGSRRNDGADQTLLVFWENDLHQGFSVTHVEGMFSGLNFRMERDPTESLSESAIYLVGSVGIDARQAKAFFPYDISKKIEDWKIGEGYSFKGKWRFQKNSTQAYADKIHFLGTLEGRGFSIKGYKFDALMAHLEYTPAAARLRDFHVEDASGVLSSDQIDLVKGPDGHWHFSIPRLKVEKFRPGILCPEGYSRPLASKPLIFREMVLEGCQGNLSSPDTIIGHGDFHFTNRSKTSHQNTIFQIPSDLLSRLGLDLSVLTPVTGAVEYHIQNGNIHLSKFKDVYSEGKLSKFNLSNASPSYIDFDGNLHVQVKMKQHNLLFKLAELFTVNIGGSLQKPSYSFLQPTREEVADHKF